VNRLFFTGAHVIDGAGAEASDVTVVVERDRILAVGKPNEVPTVASDDVVYALEGRTLMPGMVAGHAHLSYANFDPEDLNSVDMAKPATAMAIHAALNAEVTLKAGFTAAAGAGSVHQIDRVLKDMIRSGAIPGPRIMACGQDIMPTAGGMDLKPTWWNFGMTGLALIADGPIEMRRAVRLQAKEGNDFIKIYPQGGHGVPVRGGMDMEQDEIDACVQAAHDKGKLVRAHVVTKQGIMACLKAGVDVLDHADGLDDESCELMAKQGVFILPSLYLAWVMPQYYAPRGDTIAAADRIKRWFDRASVKLMRAQAAGVKIVTGDDFGNSVTPHGDNGKELAVYTDELGIPAMDVLSWATRNGAEMMRQDDKFGVIEAGKFADLLVVNGNPLKDMKLLGDPTNLSVVMQGGRFVTNTLEKAPSPALARA
jgi:imidazolonepropionase-like amidohydrolase